MARYRSDTPSQMDSESTLPRLSVSTLRLNKDSEPSLATQLQQKVLSNQVNDMRLRLVNLYKQFPDMRKEDLISAINEVKVTLKSVRESVPCTWDWYKVSGKPEVLVESIQAKVLLKGEWSKTAIKSLILEFSTVLNGLKKDCKEELEPEKMIEKPENQRKRLWDSCKLAHVPEVLEKVDTERKRQCKAKIEQAAFQLFRTN